MGLLDKHQKNNIRYKNGDFVFYSPNEIQINEIKQILSDTLSVDDKLNMNGELTSREIRYIIRELTNITEVDELSDEELLNKLNNGDRQLVLLFREIERFIYEFVEDMAYEQEQSIKFINSYINIINSNISVDKTKEKINKLLKKNKINATVDELAQIKDNPDKIIELTNKINKQN